MSGRSRAFRHLTPRSNLAVRPLTRPHTFAALSLQPSVPTFPPVVFIQDHAVASSASSPPASSPQTSNSIIDHSLEELTASIPPGRLSKWEWPKQITPSEDVRGQFLSVKQAILSPTLPHPKVYFERLVRAALANGLLKEAVDFLEEAHHKGHYVDEDLIHRTGWALQRSEAHELIPRISRLFESVVGRSSYRMLKRELWSYALTKRLDEIPPCLERVDESGFALREHSYRELVDAYLCNIDRAGVDLVLNHMERSKVPLSTGLNARIMRALPKFGLSDWSRSLVKKALHGSVPPTTEVANEALRFLLLENDVKAASEVLDEAFIPFQFDVKKAVRSGWRRVRPDGMTLSILMEGYIRNGEYDRAIRLFEHVQGLGVVPESQTIAKLITAYASKDDIHTALDILEYMCYGYTQKHAAANDAIKSLRKLAEHAFGPPDSVWKPTFSRGHTTLMSAHFVGPIRTLVRAKGVPAFDSFFQFVDATRLPIAIAPFIQILRSNAMSPKDRLRTVAELTRRTNTTDQPSVSLEDFGTKLDSYLEDVKNHPQRSSKTGTPQIPDAFLNRHAYLKLIQDAALRRNDMNLAQELFDTMVQKRGLAPTSYHYEALIRGYAKAGDMKAALSAFQAYDEQFKDRKQSAAPVSRKRYAVLLAALVMGYVAGGELDHAHAVMKKMMGHGLEPTLETIDALAVAQLKNKAFNGARATVYEYWPSSCGRLTDAIRALPVGLLIKAMWSGAGKSRKPNAPRSLSLPQALSLRRELQNTVSAWKGVTPTPSPPIKDIAVKPRFKAKSSELRGRSSLPRRPAKPWANPSEP